MVRGLALLSLAVGVGCTPSSPPAPPSAPALAPPSVPVPVPAVDDAIRALVATFLDEANGSVVVAAQHGGTPALLERTKVEDGACKLGALEKPNEVPPCGADHLIFGWQEPVELASVDVVEAKVDAVTVRANMRYPEGFLGTPANDPPHFFAQLDLVRVDGAWRVFDYRYDEEAFRRDRAR